MNKKRKKGFKQLVYTVWACWKAMIQENTFKEEWIDKNCFNDSYQLHCLLTFLKCF